MNRRFKLVILFLLLLVLVSGLPAAAAGDVITKDNAASLTLVQTITAPAAVYSVAWTPDGADVVYGLADGTVHESPLTSGGPLPPVMSGGHTDAVSSVSVSSDGQWIFSGSMDGTVRVWSASTGAMQAAPGLETVAGGPFILSVAARPGFPDQVAYAGKDSVIYQRIWNSAVMLHPPYMTGHVNFVFDAVYSPDGSLLASGGADASVRLWNPDTGGQMSNDSSSHTERVYDVAFTRDGHDLLSAGQDRMVWIRPVMMPGEPFRVAEIPDMGHDTVINAIDPTINGDAVVVGDSNGILRIYSIPSPSDIVSHLLVEINAHTDQIKDLAVSPDGTMIATAGFDSTVKLWSVGGLVLISPPMVTLVPLHIIPTIAAFCPSGPPSRVNVGMHARTTNADGSPIPIFAGPNGEMMTRFGPLQEFDIVGGPSCAAGATWWQVSASGYPLAWIQEGDSSRYYIEPYDAGSSPTAVAPTLPAPPIPITGTFCPAGPPSRLTVGAHARVTFTDGTPLRLRDSPAGTEITQMVEGTEFDVIGGPTCSGSYTWWNLRLSTGVTGWAAEGDSSSYYIEPYGASGAHG